MTEPNYTPDTAGARLAYITGEKARDERRQRWGGQSPLTTQQYGAEFDRWLNDQLAEAWDAGKRAEKRDWEFSFDLSTPDEDREPWTNPYREEQHGLPDRDS